MTRPTTKPRRGRPTGPVAAPKTHLGRRLLALRGQRSQQAVAELIGVGQSTWRRWETGEVLPGLVDLAKIVTALDTNARTLLESALTDAYAAGAI